MIVINIFKIITLISHEWFMFKFVLFYGLSLGLINHFNGFNSLYLSLQHLHSQGYYSFMLI